VLHGDGVVMTDDRSLCTKAGHCGNRFTDVWEMIRQTSDPGVRSRLEGMVDLCPSGRLDRDRPGGEEPARPSIGVIRDGPIWVRGGITIEAADGTEYEVRGRVTLCRCGHSGNKPFCDGSHKEIGFRD
jgi:hypothetical protein